MKRKLFIILTLLFNLCGFSQNLITVRNNADYTKSLLMLNSNTGEINNTIQDGYYHNDSWSFIKYSTFNPQTNEIIGIARGKYLVKKNLLTNNSTYFTISEDEDNVKGVIMAGDRLFVSLSNAIQEINPSNGNVIETHILSNPNWTTRYLTYASDTQILYGYSGAGSLFKFNITTNQQTTLPLPGLIDDESYPENVDVIFAENRLFVIRDIEGNQVYTLFEIDTENASIINTHTYTTLSDDYSDLRALTFLADTHEICGIAVGFENTAKIVKYNINTNTVSSFDLPTLVDEEYYYSIIVAITEENLSLPDFNQEDGAKVIKAYNLLGQEIPVETYNQIIILKYDNGDRKKIYIRK